MTQTNDNLGKRITDAIRQASDLEYRINALLSEISDFYITDGGAHISTEDVVTPDLERHTYTTFVIDEIKLRKGAHGITINLRTGAGDYG